MGRESAAEEGVLIVLTTVGDRESAERVARTLVEERLAACVSVIPGLESLYWWEGRLTEDSELLLIIKTLESVYDRLESRLREFHPYQVPEIVALRATSVSQAYLDWVRGEVGR
ncbi:MAG: divalent-cation tolerance protein CutA [Candidatus Korarchaeota archaeon]|nr:divalent-cation tolerance protein CutA [Candidatus Korarchaeota archaeon]